MTNINDKIRAKLTKLHAMLGSGNAGEREAAWTKIDELLRKYRRSWTDLPDLLLKTAASDPVDVGEDDPAPATNVNILDVVHYVVGEYVDLRPHEYVAVALWILHAHLFDRFLVTPRLALVSPVRGCGKTTLLALIERLLPRSHRTDNITPAVIYRLIETDHGALLIDEADNLELARNGALRAVLNSGHRKGGNIMRVIKGEPKRFSTFAPMAIAVIGGLPLPIIHRRLSSRCIAAMERGSSSGSIAPTLASTTATSTWLTRKSGRGPRATPPSTLIQTCRPSCAIAPPTTGAP
jgi:hypothetical protein